MLRLADPVPHTKGLEDADLGYTPWTPSRWRWVAVSPDEVSEHNLDTYAEDTYAACRTSFIHFRMLSGTLEV